MQQISSIAQLSPGAAVPELARTLTPLDVVKYCGAADDYAHQHWDHVYMVERGFPGIIVHGWYTFALMCQAVTNWIPPQHADVAKFSVRYHRTTLPGDITCGGEVTEVGDDGRAELKLWAKDAQGVVTTTASLIVAFP